MWQGAGGCRLKWNFLPYPPLQEELRLLQPGAETPVRRPLAVGRDSEADDRTAVPHGVEGTARVRPSTTGFPCRAMTSEESIAHAAGTIRQGQSPCCPRPARESDAVVLSDATCYCFT